MIQTSGIGRALQHQKQALSEVGVETCTNPDEAYDILHINTYGLTSGAIIQAARERGCPVVYHAHTTEEDFRNSFVFSNRLAPRMRKHLIALYSLADHIITPTPYAKRLLEGYGIQVPITAISNGIRVERFMPNPEKVKAFRNYFGLDPQQPVIISVGLYFERKGIFDFFELARKHPEITFIWFGHTPAMSIPKAVRDLLAEAPDNLILPGYVRGPIIEGAYLSADLFVFASHEETEGIVVLEALAARCPLLVRDIPVYADWLQADVHCLKAQDVLELNQKIDDFFAHRTPNTREAGYALAQARSLKAVGTQLRAVYEQLRTSA